VIRALPPEASRGFPIAFSYSFILFEAKVPKPTSEVTNLADLSYHLIRARS
jgi:hypothetical protein